MANVVNPKTFSFESLDHSKIIRYDVGFFTPNSTTPVFISAYLPANLRGTPPAMTGDLVKPAFGNNLCIKVKAVGAAAGGGEIDAGWSVASNIFDFAPEIPTLVQVS